MEQVDELKRRLDGIRPLSEGDAHLLWERYRSEMPVYVQGSNAIEGNTLTLGETVVVLQDGITVGGKTLREHLEAVNGAKAFGLMLDMAQSKRPITTNTVLALHEAVVAGEPHAGTWREGRAAITGTMHVTPSPLRVPELMRQALEQYEQDVASRHPIVAGAKLHYHIAAIHPFQDGNGRTARLVNNLHLVRHGFPPVLLRLEDGAPYIDALEKSHTAGPGGAPDLAPFIVFMMDVQERSLRHYLDVLETSHGASRGNLDVRGDRSDSGR